MVEPQGLKATLTLKATYESVSVCSCSLALSVPVPASHSLILQSELPEARVEPQGLKAMLLKATL